AHGHRPHYTGGARPTGNPEKSTATTMRENPVPSIGAPSVRHEDRHRHVPEQGPGSAAEHHLTQAGMPVGAHHDEVDLMVGGGGGQEGAGGNGGGGGGARLHARPIQ